MGQIKLRHFDLSSHIKYLTLCGFSLGLIGAIIVPILIFMQIQEGFTNYLGFAVIPIAIVFNCTICGAIAGLVSYIPFKWIMKYKKVLELSYVKVGDDDLK